MGKKLVVMLFFGILLASVVLGSGVLISDTNGIDDPNLFISLGDFLFKNGMKAQAYSVYQKALDIDSDNPIALNNIGVYFSELDKNTARDYFTKAINSDPNHELARKNLALIQHEDHEYDEAIENLVYLVEEHPENPIYTYDLAINLADKFYHVTRSVEDLDAALKNFRRCEEIEPGFMRAKENIEVLEEIKELI